MKRYLVCINIFLLSVIIFGCASTQKMDDNDVIVLGMSDESFKFYYVKGKESGNDVIITGRVKKIDNRGSVMRGVSLVAEGVDVNGSIKQKKQFIVNIEGNEGLFRIKMPYDKNLDYQVRPLHNEGFLDKMRKKYF